MLDACLFTFRSPSKKDVHRNIITRGHFKHARSPCMHGMYCTTSQTRTCTHRPHFTISNCNKCMTIVYFMRKLRDKRCQLNLTNRYKIGRYTLYILRLFFLFRWVNLYILRLFFLNVAWDLTMLPSEIVKYNVVNLNWIFFSKKYAFWCKFVLLIYHWYLIVVFYII